MRYGEPRFVAADVLAILELDRTALRRLPGTGDLVSDPPPVRVTVKGLERLRVRLERFDQGAPALALVGIAA